MSELLPGGYSLSFSVDSETANQRIDRTVADAFPELSRSRIQHMENRQRQNCRQELQAESGR